MKLRRQKFLDFCSAAPSADDSDRFAGLMSTIGALGFTQHHYVRLHFDQKGEMAALAAHSSMNTDFLDEFMAEGMHANDFAVEFCRANEGSILWSQIEDLSDRGKLSPLESRTVSFARDNGMSSGIVLSLPKVRSTMGETVTGMSLIPDPGTRPGEFDPVIRENRSFLTALAEVLTDDLDHAALAAMSLSLSARDLRILDLLASGYYVQQISDALAISDRTTAHHIANIRKKLVARTTAQAVARAVRLGLL